MREIMRSLQLPDILPGKTQSNFWFCSAANQLQQNCRKETKIALTAI